MRDPKRIYEAMNLLTEIWAKNPDLRFNQLIYNIQRDYSQKHNDVGLVEMDDPNGFTVKAYDLFNLEDDEFIKHLRALRDNTQ
ncbi:hypothetical protein [Photobacterium leiognathi]|uniref:hypothetical protein n=1 Tax=Photobacterium leiognathi TaxID=553611 RepID=UPI00298258CA|nr:hypothetical protein [Photobacterium leiognathi]